MLVIWNPNAGSVRNAARIKSELTRNRDVELAETNSSDEAIELVCRQIGQGERRIVAAGGDGTVNAVINGMMRESSDAELAVLPLGTANDWCASLGIPDDLWQAKSLIDGWNARPLDIIELESPHVHKYFANIATGGQQPARDGIHHSRDETQMGCLVLPARRYRNRAKSADVSRQHFV